MRSSHSLTPSPIFPFSMQSVSYQTKVSDQFFPGLLVVFIVYL
jgi:hypothetical protein